MKLSIDAPELGDRVLYIEQAMGVTQPVLIDSDSIEFMTMAIVVLLANLYCRE